MNYEQYLAMRNQLLNEATALVNEGKFEEAEAKSAEVTALDERWDAQAKAQANLNALAGNQRQVDMTNISGQVGVIDQTAQNAMSAEDAAKSEDYVNAWAKFMMNNRNMTQAESQAFQMVNDATPYTHTTENTPIVIPETVSARIWTAAEEMYPFWADAFKTYVKGNLKMIKEKASTDAGWYVEDEATADGKEEFGVFELSGCELARAISISWKLKEMAIADFLNYIVKKMAQKMGKALAYGATHGAGKVENENPEPLGVVTALTKESNTPQIVTYTTLDYDKLVDGRSKVASSYKPAIYANSTTVWQQIAKVKDGEGRPIFVADPMAGGAYRVLGCIIKEDDSMTDGEILFGDASAYQANINKQVSMMTEEHVKARVTDYCAYAIVDGAPIDTKAFSLLKK